MSATVLVVVGVAGVVLLCAGVALILLGSRGPDDRG
jgi:hypothetical protein